MNSNTYTELQAVKKLRETLKIIRAGTPVQSFDLLSAASSDVRFGYLQGRPVKRLVVTLRSSGCGWVRKGFGCTMCGHWAGTTKGKSIPEGYFLTQFKNEIKKHDFSDIPILCLYNGGSILNVDELPSSALINICREISTIKGIKKVVFETKSEYVTEEVIENIKNNLRQDDVEIAMGLESSNEKVRKLCLNKGLNIADFKRAVGLIKKNFGFRLYIMIKPIFLTEAEGIKDAVASFNDSLEFAPDEVHFEPATIQEHTLSYYLYKSGFYRPPWLWSIIEVIKQLPHGKRAYISPFAHTPSPIVVPHNCNKCTAKASKMITEEYNVGADISIFDGLSCKCKGKHARELEFTDSRSIEERMMVGCQLVQQVYDGAIVNNSKATVCIP